MKSILYTLVAGLLFFSSPALSQSLYEKGDISVNAGFSLGLIGYGYGYYGSAGFSVPLTANVEYSLNEMVGVGGYVGYLGRTYRYLSTDRNFTALALGGQAVFHASPFLNEHLDLEINEDKVDYYGRVILGFETRTWRYNGAAADGLYNNSVVPRFGPVFGVRYMFKPNFGGYAEGGRGAFGWLTLGVTLKL